MNYVNIKEHELRPVWRKFFTFDWKFSILLIFLVCIPRFLLVLNANETANYSFIGLIMITSALAPFVFLTKYGRRSAGFKKPENFSGLLLGFLSGLILSYGLYYFGTFLYQNTYQNWYTYIGQSYAIPAGINAQDKQTLFIIMAFTGMIFSPVGEEFFFRGIVHSGLEKSMGDSKASFIDSSAFALTHLSHFGLVFVNQKWTFLPIPALLWVAGMFLVSRVFFFFRKKTDSIWGAVICHSAFNLGMIYCIFYLLN